MSIGDKIDAIAANVAETRETVARIEERQLVVKKDVTNLTKEVFGEDGLKARVGGLERIEKDRKIRSKRIRGVAMAVLITVVSTLGTIVVTDVWNRFTSPAKGAATPTTGPAR